MPRRGVYGAIKHQPHGKGYSMKNKFIARLTKDVEIKVSFESISAETGVKFSVYQVPTVLKAGERQFKTKEKALNWVALMENDYGVGTAMYIGKF
jgi:hypothetical protein